MLGKIVEASLGYRLLVIVALAVLTVFGIRSWYLLPVDAFPDVTPIQVGVLTEAPGLAAEDVEQLLTFTIESSLAGLPDVQMIRSVSLFGLSTVTVYFEDGVDIYFARRLVSEKLQQIRSSIPEGYEPELSPNSSGLGQVFWYTVENADNKLSNMELRTLQDWEIRLQLMAVPGVDDVVSWGGIRKQFQVLIDPNKLVAYGLGFSDVMTALLDNNRLVGGGYIDVQQEQYLVRGSGLVGGSADILQVPVRTVDGTPVFIRDIAEVREDGGQRAGAVTRDGKEVVLGMALQRIGENAKDVSFGVKSKLDVVRQTLPQGVTINPVYDRTRLVDLAIATATNALFEGAVLVIIILYLFLGEIRSALVVVLALPLSILIAVSFMEWFGLSANLMSLAGLAVGMGMMIDGAVVLVENSYRLLSHAASEGEARTQVVRQAALEVVKPVAFAILVILVVFLPLFSLIDIEGKLFKPMAFSITFAMLGSLALILTGIPVLASLILRARNGSDTVLVRWAKRLYLPVLNYSLSAKRTTFTISAVVLGMTLLLLPFLGKEFMPTLQEGSLLFRINNIPSTSLDQSILISEQAELAVLNFPQVLTAVGLVGRAENGEPEDVNQIEMLVELADKELWPEALSYDALSDQMQRELERALPVATISAGQPIQTRVDELVSGVKAPLSLKIFGNDLAALDRLGEEARAILENVSGVEELSLQTNKGKPQINVRVNRLEAALYGVSADEILEVIAAGIGGETAGVVLDGNRRFDVRVWLQPEFRSGLETIRNLPLRSKDGALIPLSRLANVDLSEGYGVVSHENLQRHTVLQMDVSGRDVNGFVQEAQAALQQQLELPTGYRLEWGGAFENQQRAMTRLAIIVPITIGLIFILLYTAFNSAALAGLIIANVPFAVVGGVLALFVSGQYLSVPSVIGFIAVFGVAMLNGIVLVSFMNEQVALGKSVRDAVRHGAMMRLRPVLMTASVTILGLLPMLFSQGVGAEIQRPLATVVVGGLFSSTILTLVLLPLMYEWLISKLEVAPASYSW